MKFSFYFSLLINLIILLFFLAFAILKQYEKIIHLSFIIYHYGK